MTNWKQIKFSDFLQINPTISLKGKEGFSFIEMKDLNDGQRFAYPSQERIIAGGARFGEGDTLFARITPCLENGKICQAKGLNNGIGFGSTEFLVFRERKNISDKNFIYYLSRWEEVRRYAELNLVGTSGRQRVPKDVFDKLELTLPNLQTQKKIAELLSSFDEKIELNRRMNQTLEQMAMTLYKEWFIDFGPFKNSEFIESELGFIPKGWKVYQLNEIANFRYGRMPKKELLTTSGYPVYSGYGITGYYPDFNSEKSKVVVVARGVGGTGDVKLTPAKCFVTNLTIILDSNPEKLIDKIFYYRFVKRKLKELSSGSAQPQITINDLERIKIELPDVSIQNEFLKLVKPFEDKVEVNTREIETLSTLRDYLLPKLMSGEIDVMQTKAQELYEPVLS